MNVLVLSGGAIKGAFEAGAIEVLADSGWHPDLVVGISVGALNAAYLSDRAGFYASRTGTNWSGLARSLVDFWETRVVHPDVIATKRSWLSVGWSIATGSFKGLTDTEPLRRLLYGVTDAGRLAASPLPSLVGSVDLVTGGLVYAGNTDPQFREHVLASAAIPIAMPAVEIDGHPHVDGGVRDVTPYGTAIGRGARSIVAITCQPRGIGAKEVKAGDALGLVTRTLDILTDEIMVTDGDQVELINELVRSAPDHPLVRSKGWKLVDHRTIRPADHLGVDIGSFTRGDITRMIEAGRNAARAALATAAVVRRRASAA